MERKIFPAQVIQADEAQGIVETIFAVMGNIDDGNDVIHPGAFTKTFAERGHKVRVLDQHRTDSIMAVLGKPLELRELDRAQLPPDLLARVPEATGGAYAKIRFMMDTPEGKGAFIRLREGSPDEWSFGYDALDTDYSQAVKDGAAVTVRNLRSLRLYEISPVLWGMNPATVTTGVKAAPSEGKPYDIFREGDEWLVCRVNADGERMGDPLGRHATEEEAQAQLAALYANVEDAGKAAEPDSEEKAGRVLAARNARRIQDAIGKLQEALKDAGLMDEIQEEDDMQSGKAGPQPETPTPPGAGPSEDEAPTSEVPPERGDDLLRLIEIEQSEISLLEV